MSSATFVELTNKSLPLVTKILNDLIGRGVVYETHLASSTGGRRPQLYALKPDLMYIVAVAVDQLITRIVILDMTNRYVTELEKFESKLSNNTSALEVLSQRIKQHVTNSGISKERIIGVGISMPGFIDVKKGLNHSFFKMKEGNIVSYIESVIDLPVLIDNDSSLIALAEHKLGSFKGKKNVMVLNIGWGVGLGMILNGELFRGENGFAGEFSHIPLFNNNKICSCSKLGCLETETSLLVIIEKAIEGLKNGKPTILKDISYDDSEVAIHNIIDAALHGDKFAIQLVSESGYNLGRGIAILVHLLNPDLVILSGRGSSAGKLWLTPIQQALNEHCIPKIAENLSVKISTLGDKADIIGAAALVMENFDKLVDTIDEKKAESKEMKLMA